MGYYIRTAQNGYAPLSLYFAYCSFVRIHSKTGVTLVMEA
jgi:hypothetical protein